jgi:hypothetical protein
MVPRYHVVFFVSFGERATETFYRWSDMRMFLRQLKPGQVLDYGEIHTQHSEHRRAA